MKARFLRPSRTPEASYARDPVQVQVLEEAVFDSAGSKEMPCYQSTLDTIDVYNLGNRCENQVDVHIVDIWDVQAFCRHCDRWLKGM